MQNSPKVPNLLQQVHSMVPNYCDKCGAKHMKSDLEVVEKGGEKMTFKLGCNACKNTYIIHVSLTPEGLLTSRQSFKSDISDAEYEKFSNLEDIDPEEILEVFLALEGVDTLNEFQDLLSASD